MPKTSRGIMMHKTLKTLLILQLLILTIQVSKAGIIQEDFYFIVMGDNRPSTETPVVSLLFKELIKYVNWIRPDFAVNTGDLIYGSGSYERARAQYEEFKRAIEECKVPYYTVIGNHDARGRGEELYQEILGRPLYYSFNHKGCHFVFLSTEIKGETGGIYGEQLEWLREDLMTNSNATLTFVFLHRPVWPVGPHMSDSFQNETNKQIVVSLFKEYGVDYVFAGHEHLFDYSEHDGIVQIITGGAGAPLYADPENGGVNHLLLVHVTGGKAEITLIRFRDLKVEVTSEKHETIIKIQNSVSSHQFKSLAGYTYSVEAHPIPLNGIEVSIPHTEKYEVSGGEVAEETVSDGSINLRIKVTVNPGETREIKITYGEERSLLLVAGLLAIVLLATAAVLVWRLKKTAKPKA